LSLQNFLHPFPSFTLTPLFVVMDNLQRTMWFKGPDSLIFEYSQRYIKSANISERICSKNQYKLIKQK
jgi:hypothetical protein